MITAEEARNIVSISLAKEKAKTLQYLEEINTWGKIKEEANKGKTFALIYVYSDFIPFAIEILKYQGFSVEEVDVEIDYCFYNLKILW